MLFKDIVGQEELKTQLAHTANSGRIAHAQLFLGPEGSAALPLAIAYAQYINCEAPQNNDSCGNCPSCRKYSKLIHPDLHFIFPFFPKEKGDTSFSYSTEWRAAMLEQPYLEMEQWRSFLEVDNKQANINIATCHEAIKKLSLKAYEARYKVVIIWLPEYLDKEGNSLLKVIEEPPENTLFLLVAQQQEQLLSTIRSRTQLTKIPKLRDQDIRGFLTNEKGLAETDVQEITFLAQGNISLAIQLAQTREESFQELLKNWLRQCWTADVIKLNETVEVFAKLGRENQKEFFSYAIGIIRESLLYGQKADSLLRVSEGEREFISRMQGLANAGNIPALVRELELASYHIERNANPKILFLDLSLAFVRLIKWKDVNSLLSFTV